MPRQQLQLHTPSCRASLYYLQRVPSRNPGLSVKFPTQTSPLILSHPPQSGHSALPTTHTFLITSQALPILTNPQIPLSPLYSILHTVSAVILSIDLIHNIFIPFFFKYIHLIQFLNGKRHSPTIFLAIAFQDGGFHSYTACQGLESMTDLLGSWRGQPCKMEI